jgi:hypothetical protein
MLVGVFLLAFGLILLSQTGRYAIVSIASYCLYGVPSDKDRRDAEAVRNVIYLAHPFTATSASTPGHAPVFLTAGSSRLLASPAVIYIYGVKDKHEQERIIDAAQGVITARQSGPVEIRFCDAENCIVHGNVGLRGREEVLLRVTLKAR